MDKLEKKLHDICEAVRIRVRTINYSELGEMCSRSSMSAVEVVGSLMKIIEEIKEMCTEDEKAFFEFFFERVDYSDRLLPLFHLARLAYPDNIQVGVLIVKKYRDDRVQAVPQIMKVLGYGKSKSEYIVKDGKKELTALYNQFTNTNKILASDIEKILIDNKLIK